MSTIDNVLAKISKDLDVDLARLEKVGAQPIERLTSGSKALDEAMGGGWCKGRVHEIYGAESGGKTFMTLMAIKNAQAEGLSAALVDAEHAFDPMWAEGLGLNTKDLVVFQPDHGEQGLNVVLRLVESGKFGIVVIDSVAGLVPKAEIEGEIGDLQVGAQARMMGQALRKIVPAASESKTIVIFINQLRLKIGVMFGNPETTPGGMALRFYSSIRLDARRVSKSEVLDENKAAVGHSIKVKVVKNKTATPYREAIVPINYKTGIVEAP